ncbi:MAG: cupin domain-containing protein [Candidatus Binatus sp.]|uniref:cupin domain-containing protein n=1 Tax=Candidatus Binatus sp. TaxID=2811406 RepID=UPI002727BD20|nr:cupin domain-containing protein [Candidatus Binatus sp.]MDO8434774.1 cupin domain-containing protein [Candidatus Binatus sp.]
MLEKMRRVVTGHDKGGKSMVLIDGPPGTIVERGLAGLGEVWITDGSPADNSGKKDSSKRKLRLEPPKRGSVIRFFTIAPEQQGVSAAEMEKEFAATFKAIGGKDARVDTSRHPGMHTTKTVDYIIVLDGEVTLILDRENVKLKPFDVVVQRGTNHAWTNPGTKPALLAGVLIDAKKL